MPSDDPRDLTDLQWASLNPLIPEPTRRNDRRGRPWKDRRAVLNGVLWVLRTGAPWAELPDRYPSYQTCHRRFQQWVRSGILKECWKPWPRTCMHRVVSMFVKRSSMAVLL